MECYSSFHKDRELDKWSKKLLEEDSNSSISIKSLDFLLSQVASMREIVNKHYIFMHSTLSPIFLRDLINVTDGLSGSSLLNSRSRDYIEEMLIVSSDEMNKWRELDAVYIMLEFGYMKRAVNDALCETLLLEMEAGAHVPQAVEDIFFIFRRSSQRAASTGSEQCVFAIGNKIVEMLRISDNNDPDGFDANELFYKYISSRLTFKNCVRKNAVSTAAVDALLVRSSLMHVSPLEKTPSKKELPSLLPVSSAGGGPEGEGKKEGPVSELSAELSAAVEIANGVGDIISKGAIQMLTRIYNPYFTTVNFRLLFTEMYICIFSVSYYLYSVYVLL